MTAKKLKPQVYPISQQALPHCNIQQLMNRVSQPKVRYREIAHALAVKAKNISVAMVGLKVIEAQYRANVGINLQIE